MLVRYKSWKSSDARVFIYREMLLFLHSKTNRLCFWKEGATAPSFDTAPRVLEDEDEVRDDEARRAQISSLDACTESASSTASRVRPHRLHTRMLMSEYGIWVVEDDAVPRGAFEDIPACVSIYGLALSDESVARLHTQAAALRALDHTHGVNCSPLSLYHGTNLASAVALLQGRDAPRACHGMLGNGFYLGSFFKACRFASRTQDYALRVQGDGVVLRARAFVSRSEIAESHKKRRPCACDECAAALRKEPFSDARKRMALLVDHESLWKQAGMKAVHLGVSEATKLGTHRGEFGGHYMSRHDEWCVVESRILPCDAAFLDFASIDQTRYNPLERTQRVM